MATALLPLLLSHTTPVVRQSSSPPSQASVRGRRRHPFPASPTVSGRREADMDCPEAKSGEVAVACPPDDPLVEIFSRLPAKPLFRFKCVSKDWCSLIADRLRCRKFPQSLEGFFTAGGNVAEIYRGFSYGGFIDLSGRPVPLVDPSFSFLTELPEIEKILLWDSCNGLVLFEHGRPVLDSDDEDDFDSLGYIVCNPATQEWVSVPSAVDSPCGWDPDSARCYLIFDPAISPHFQLIHLRMGSYLFGFSLEVHTFSSVTGAWRQELEGVLSLTGFDMGACCFDGMLHVGVRRLLRSSQNQPHIPSEYKHMILAIGGEGRPFRTLHWPKNDRGFIVFIGQSQGHLLCLSGCKTEGSQTTELSIWVLVDYDAEKWVLRNNVNLAQLFSRTRQRRWHADWTVVGIHSDRGLVFFADYWNHKLISYDMDKKEVRVVCSLHGYDRPIIPYVPYFAQSAAFTKNC